jgi:hypothetical protein
MADMLRAKIAERSLTYRSRQRLELDPGLRRSHEMERLKTSFAAVNMSSNGLYSNIFGKMSVRDDQKTVDYIEKMLDLHKKKKIQMKLGGIESSLQKKTIDSSIFTAAKKTLEFDSSASSKHSMSGVLGFAVCTSKGRVKQQNEDRANVIFNVTDQQDKSNCFSYFSIFDGHGGAGCSSYLRDHLHEMILNSKHFPHKIKDALSEAISRADTDCLQRILAKEIEPRSGSTALVAIVSSSSRVT